MTCGCIYWLTLCLLLHTAANSVSISRSKPRLTKVFHPAPVSPQSTTVRRQSIVTSLKEADSAGTLTLGVVENAVFAANELADWALVMEIYGGFAKQCLHTAEQGDKRSFFEKLLTIMMRCGGQVHIYLLVNDALAQGCTPTDSTLTFILQHLSEKGELSIMTAIIDQVSRFDGTVISNRAYMALLNACDRAKAYDAMLSIYYTKMDSTMLDFVAVGVILKACDRLRRSDTAVEIFESLLDTYVADDRFYESIPASVAERVIAILVRDGAGELAVRVLLQLELWQSGVADEASHGSDDGLDDAVLIDIVGKLISTHEGRRQDSRRHPDGVREPSKGKNSAFLSIAYDDLDPIEKGAMQLLGTDPYGYPDSDSDSDSDSAEEEEEEEGEEAEFQATFDLLLEMQSAPVCSQRIYAGVISALSKAGRATECRLLLESYKGRGGQPTEEMFTSSIYAHRYSHNVTAAVEMLSSLKEAPETDLTIASYNALLLVLGVCGELPSQKERFLAEIRERGLQLNRESYTALIMGAADSSQRSALWREMVEHRGITPTIASVKEVLRVSDGNTSLEILDYLWSLPPQEKTIAPKVASTHKYRRSRIRATRRPPGPPVHGAHGNRHPPAKQQQPVKWESAKQQQGHPQESLEEQGRGQRRQLVRPRWEIQRPQPSVEVCNLALASLAAENRSEDCLALINRMRSHEMEPTPRSYRTAVSSFSEESSDWTSAIQLLIQVQAKGMSSCLGRALRAALRCCRNGGRWDLTRKLLVQASLADRFQLAPAMVEDAVLTAFHTGGDVAWLQGLMRRRRAVHQGEEQPALHPEIMVGKELSAALREFLSKAAIDVQVV